MTQGRDVEYRRLMTATCCSGENSMSRSEAEADAVAFGEAVFARRVFRDILYARVDLVNVPRRLGDHGVGTRRAVARSSPTKKVHRDVSPKPIGRSTEAHSKISRL